MISQGLLRSAALLCLTAGATWATCTADTLVFTATLTGSQETPVNPSTASGFGTVTLNGNLLTVSESFFNLSAPAAGAHIHCCASPGVSAAIAVPFAIPPFPAATSGTFAQTFDLSTFLFTNGFTETTFLAGLESGLTYLNIHDRNFGAGEIRGQLVQVTPEPASLALLATGVLGAASLIRRRAAARAL